MYKLKIKEKTYELETNLGTIAKLEDTLGYTYINIIQNTANFKVFELKEILLVGAQKEEKDEISKAIDDNFGAVALLEEVGYFLEKLSYPEKTDQQVKIDVKKRVKDVQTSY